MSETNTQKKGKLYLIPTPLAENTNQKMVTAELEEVLKSVDYFLVENIRTARRFISSLNLGLTIEDLRFEVLNKDTNKEDVDDFCAPLLEGKDIGVMSEAGCPGVADPGNLAVQYAHQHTIEVIPLAGPSSILMALMASGFNGQSFTFHGYLPIDQNPRRHKIQELEKDVYRKKTTQIFMETPYRNNQLLDDLRKLCKPYTKLCVAKDISGEQQTIVTKSIQDWRKYKLDLHKVPTVFLLYKD